MAIYPSQKQARNGNLPSGGEQHQGGQANAGTKEFYAREVEAAVAQPGVHRQAEAGGAK